MLTLLLIVSVLKDSNPYWTGFEGLREALPFMLKTPFIYFTNEETRTLKPLRAPSPKHGSYTNSDTFAICHGAARPVGTLADLIV
jgi:hypothetical protein